MIGIRIEDRGLRNGLRGVLRSNDCNDTKATHSEHPHSQRAKEATWADGLAHLSVSVAGRDESIQKRIRSARVDHFGKTNREAGWPHGDRSACTICFSLLRCGERLRVMVAIDWQAFWLTLQLAIVVSAILVALGLPIAYWIAFARWRWKFLIEATVALPIVLPPTVLGFYVLVALGPRSPLGQWWISLTGHTLAFTFSGLVIGSILYSLPFAVQPFAASFAGVDGKLIAASATLGASPLRTFFA